MRTISMAFGCVLMVAGCKRGPEKVEPAAGEGAEAVAQDVPCGQNICRGGQVCCNPSCGICALPDGMCTQLFCDAPRTDNGAQEPLPPAPTTCDHVRCADGTHCEMVEVQCVKAPCPTVPECKQEEPRSNEQR
jgi:hypothetical protein